MSPVLEYPYFIEYITELCDEFRLIKAKIRQEKPLNWLPMN